jgi:hypothetical protein
MSMIWICKAYVGSGSIGTHTPEVTDGLQEKLDVCASD